MEVTVALSASLESDQLCTVNADILQDGVESVLVGSGKLWGNNAIRAASGTDPNTGFSEIRTITTIGIVEITAGTPHTFSVSGGSVESGTGNACATHVQTTFSLTDLGAL
jgi:hypothetical protein